MIRPWMPLYISDYLADTAHLSTAEHGAYMLLIMAYWAKGGLPQDEEAIRRITRMTPRQWSHSCDLLRSLFLPGWRHKRIDEEMAKAIEKSKVNSANAQRRHSERTANAQRTHTQPQSQSQIEEERERALPAADAAPAVSDPVVSKPKRTKSRSSYPDGWRPDFEYAIGEGVDARSVAAVAGKFENYHRSRGSLMADWPAAWRTWVANEIKPRGGAPPGRKQSFLDIADQAFSDYHGNSDEFAGPSLDLTANA